MSDLISEVDDVDPVEWMRSLENSLKHEISNCCMSDKIRFIKKMIDRLKLTLDDIRGVNKSDKYSALNSVPPDVLPIKINLADGETIVLLEVNPVITYYDDLLTNVRGDIVHLYVRRKGEELPEDFLPPRKMFNLSPPPPGFVRSPLLKLLSVDRNCVPKPKPCSSKELDTPLYENCEEEPTLGVNRVEDTAFDEKNLEKSAFKTIREDDITSDKKHGAEMTLNISKIEDSVHDKSKEVSKFDTIKKEDPSLNDPHQMELILDASKLQELSMKDKHQEESLADTSTEENTTADKKLKEEAALNVSKDKYTHTNEKHQKISVPCISIDENSPTDEINSVVHAAYTQKYSDSCDEDNSNDEKHSVESVINISDESCNISSPKTQEVEPFNIIDLDSCTPTNEVNRVAHSSYKQEYIPIDKKNPDDSMFDSCDEDNSNDENHSVESVINISDESSNLSGPKTQEVESFNVIDLDSCTPTDVINRVAHTAYKQEFIPIDKKNSDDSMFDSCDKDNSNDEKHSVESVINISDESSNLSGPKTQEVEPSTIIDLDSSSGSSTDVSDSFQVLGLMEIDPEVEEPEVVLEKQRKRSMKRC